MFICRNCGKFSKQAIEQYKKAACPKCGWDFSKPVQGPKPLKAKEATEGQGAVVLHPGFSGVIELEPGKGYGESRSFLGKPEQRYILRYAEAMDIPGTAYHHILPTQELVSRKIVARKMEEIKEQKLEGVLPSVDVAKEKGQKGLALAYDGHHTFVAALKLGSPIVLLLCGGLENGAKANWTKCTYVDQFGNEDKPKGEEYSLMPPIPKGWPNF